MNTMRTNLALSTLSITNSMITLYCFDVPVAMNAGLLTYRPKTPCFLAIPVTGNGLQVMTFEVVQL